MKGNADLNSPPLQFSYLLTMFKGNWVLSDPRTKLLPNAARLKATVSFHDLTKSILLKKPVSKCFVIYVNVFFEPRIRGISFTSNADFIVRQCCIDFNHIQFLPGITCMMYMSYAS